MVRNTITSLFICYFRNEKRVNQKLYRMKSKFNRFIVLIMLLLLPAGMYAQEGGGPQNNSKISIGIHADPLVSWFSSDIDSVRNDGARSGFNFGLTFNYFFRPNYAFSTGINLISAGGRLVAKDATLFNLSDNNNMQATIVEPDKAIVYKIQYLSIPIGLKLQTNQIGYITFFTDLGLDPKIVIGSKVDIPSNDIENRKAPEEVKTLNISYHAIAGIEYAIGGNTSLVIGIGFENNFADITTDLKGDFINEVTFDQFKDKISHKMISIRFGVNF